MEHVDVAETRISTKGDDILNVALTNEMDTKELFIRRAESRNDNLTVRCYIPPNFHDRFMSLNKICMEKRKQDPSLRTQLRFGSKDIEVWTKYKNEEKGFRRVNMEEFTDQTVPEFNHTIKWKRYHDKLPRRTNRVWQDPGQRPSTIGQVRNRGLEFVNTMTDMDTSPESPASGQTTEVNPLIRSNSNTVVSRTKKTRWNNAPSSEEEEYLSGSEESTKRTCTPANQNLE